MTKLFLFISFLLLATCTYSQKLSQVSILDGAKLSYFSIQTEQNVLIRISDEGKVLEWGLEVMSERSNYYAPRLQPFLARVEYYDQYSDSSFKGKVKSIGTCFITYYGANETEQKRGKPKSFGSLYLDYYSNYDEKRLQGKLKMLGTLSFEYYRPYENEAYRGKLKSIGSTAITYYSAFDDRYNTGKIKTIGAVSYVWYSPLNHTYLRGGLKTNNYRQVISGTTYILQ